MIFPRSFRKPLRTRRCALPKKIIKLNAKQLIKVFCRFNILSNNDDLWIKKYRFNEPNVKIHDELCKLEKAEENFKRISSFISIRIDFFDQMWKILCRTLFSHFALVTRFSPLNLSPDESSRRELWCSFAVRRQLFSRVHERMHSIWKNHFEYSASGK